MKLKFYPKSKIEVEQTQAKLSKLGWFIIIGYIIGMPFSFFLQFYGPVHYYRISYLHFLKEFLIMYVIMTLMTLAVATGSILLRRWILLPASVIWSFPGIFILYGFIHDSVTDDLLLKAYHDSLTIFVFLFLIIVPITFFSPIIITIRYWDILNKQKAEKT